MSIQFDFSSFGPARSPFPPKVRPAPHKAAPAAHKAAPAPHKAAPAPHKAAPAPHKAAPAPHKEAPTPHKADHKAAAAPHKEAPTPHKADHKAAAAPHKEAPAPHKADHKAAAAPHKEAPAPHKADHKAAAAPHKAAAAPHKEAPAPHKADHKQDVAHGPEKKAADHKADHKADSKPDAAHGTLKPGFIMTAFHAKEELLLSCTPLYRRCTGDDAGGADSDADGVARTVAASACGVLRCAGVLCAFAAAGGASALTPAHGRAGCAADAPFAPGAQPADGVTAAGRSDGTVLAVPPAAANASSTSAARSSAQFRSSSSPSWKHTRHSTPCACVVRAETTTPPNSPRRNCRATRRPTSSSASAGGCSGRSGAAAGTVIAGVCLAPLAPALMAGSANAAAGRRTRPHAGGCRAERAAGLHDAVLVAAAGRGACARAATVPWRHVCHSCHVSTDLQAQPEAARHARGSASVRRQRAARMDVCVIVQRKSKRKKTGAANGHAAPACRPQLTRPSCPRSRSTAPWAPRRR
jgi:hypothetical protein